MYPRNGGNAGKQTQINALLKMLRRRKQDKTWTSVIQSKPASQCKFGSSIGETVTQRMLIQYCIQITNAKREIVTQRMSNQYCTQITNAIA
jgi:polysaccharide pyruvyl transferase WcaK-like protein